VKAVVRDLFECSRIRSGCQLDVAFDTVGALRDRVLAGDRPDVVILSAPAMKHLTEQRLLDRGRTVELGRTGVALAGPEGSPRAAMETAEGFSMVLRAAPSIGYADHARGATAGAHFVRCLDRLGLADALRNRLKVFPFGVDAVSAVGRGEVAFAVSQATEIVPQPEVAFLGMFPDECQIWTAYEAAALSDRPEAHEFMDALESSAGAAALARVGFLRTGETARPRP
jgi:molybdate transport system substrate-binding protein